MTVRVLVVDDSSFYRRRVIQALKGHDDIEVVGEAGNGKEAVEMVRRLNPDVVTMDVNMPLMDGITAVRNIMSVHPTPILMFSSVTTEGARATLDALDAGAVDFIPKHLEEMHSDRSEALSQLCRRVHTLGSRRHRMAGMRTEAPVATGAARGPRTGIQDQTLHHAVGTDHVHAFHDVRLIIIGTSTGGPVAVQRLLSQLPEHYPFPILIVQHMPGPFTKAFAERLDKICQSTVKEAQDGDQLRPGTVLVAPGGKQTTLKCRGASICVEVKESTPADIYKPSVDVTFISAAKALPGKVLGVVLTGMGADGKEGAGLLKAGDSHIWAQDEHSSVIFGMPKAVIDAGYADQVMSLNHLGAALAGLT